jgi:hypothetical protein
MDWHGRVLRQRNPVQLGQRLLVSQNLDIVEVSHLDVVHDYYVEVGHLYNVEILAHKQTLSQLNGVPLTKHSTLGIAIYLLYLSLRLVFRDW